MSEVEQVRPDAVVASRPETEREGQAPDIGAVDQRPGLLALLPPHDSTIPLRARAIRQLSQQHGNRYVARQLEPRARPGTIEVTQVGGPAGVVAREGGGGASAVTPVVSPAVYTVSGKTLAEAYESIQAYAASHDGEAGSVKWNPKWSLPLDDDGKVKSASITVTIKKTMPSWPGAAKLSKKAKAEWDRAFGELNAHENEHVKKFTEGAAALGATTVVGLSNDAANAALTTAVDNANTASAGIDPFTTILDIDADKPTPKAETNVEEESLDMAYY